MSCTPIVPFLPQVTRIPIGGPAPFNTLVVVAGGGVAPLNVPAGVGQLFVTVLSAPTEFRLAGFDQRVAPIFQHSTTCTLAGFAPAESGLFQYGVNSILGAGFDPFSGTYYVNVEVGLNIPKIPSSFCAPFCVYWVKWSLSSFVLVNEPPLPPAPKLAGGAQASLNAPRVTGVAELGALEELATAMRSTGPVAGGLGGRNGTRTSIALPAGRVHATVVGITETSQADQQGLPSACPRNCPRMRSTSRCGCEPMRNTS